MAWMQPLVGEHWDVRGRRCVIKEIVPAPKGSSEDTKYLYVLEYEDGGKDELISDVNWQKLQPWGPYD